jgi:hypothetical protein
MMDEKQQAEVYRGIVTNAFQTMCTGRIATGTAAIRYLAQDDLNNVYKASKQLSNLCWHEIQRRRREAMEYSYDDSSGLWVKKKREGDAGARK